MLKAWMHAHASVAMARVVRRAAGEPAEGTPGPGTSSVAPPSAPTLTLEVDSVRMAVSRFNGWVANAAHAAGLAVFQKNGPDKILLTDRSLMMMVDKFDGILNEECQ